MWSFYRIPSVSPHLGRLTCASTAAHAASSMRIVEENVGWHIRTNRPARFEPPTVSIVATFVGASVPSRYPFAIASASARRWLAVALPGILITFSDHVLEVRRKR